MKYTFAPIQIARDITHKTYQLNFKSEYTYNCNVNWVNGEEN